MTYLLGGSKCLCRGSGEELDVALLGAGARRSRQQGGRDGGFRLVEPRGCGARGAVGGGALGEAGVQWTQPPLFQRGGQLCWRNKQVC